VAQQRLAQRQLKHTHRIAAARHAGQHSNAGTSRSSVLWLGVWPTLATIHAAVPSCLQLQFWGN
jgi:hypothetical protein